MVNLSLKKMNAYITNLDLNPLLDVGTCSLHIIHNALKTGVVGLECDIENFAYISVV